MRGSIHLLPRQGAHLAFRAVPEPPSAMRRRLRYAGLTEESYRGLRDTVLAAADRPRTAGELGEALGEGTGYDGSPPPVLGGMAREGVLLGVGSEGLRSNALRHVATRAWLGGDLPAADADAPRPRWRPWIPSGSGPDTCCRQGT